MLDLLARRSVPLIKDDIYGDIYFGQERPRPFMALDRRGNTIYCSSFSQDHRARLSHRLDRAGSLLGPRARAEFALTLCGPALLHAAFAEFLGLGGYDSHLRRIRRVFADNIGRMSRAIDRAFPKCTRVSQPAGGFVLWLELPEPLRSRALFDAALEDGICFAPGDVFSASSRYANCLRLSCGHPWDAQIERAIEKLGALISGALGRSKP